MEAIRRDMQLHPDKYWPYFCYNCGSQSHGARLCPHPPRGTAENTYVPNIPKAPRRVGDEWVCAVPHPLDAAPNPNNDLILSLQELQDSYSSADKDIDVGE